MALFGVVAGLLFALIKWAVIFGVIALAGVGAYKLLAGPDRGRAGGAFAGRGRDDEGRAMLAEIRRKQLTK